MQAHQVRAMPKIDAFIQDDEKKFGRMHWCTGSGKTLEMVATINNLQRNNKSDLDYWSSVKFRHDF